MALIGDFRELRAYRAAFDAWRKRRYPAAFVAKLNDAETEAAETRSHLDFALACGYIDRRAYEALDQEYESLIRQIVRMMDRPERWIPGRASGRVASAARAHSPPPTPGARRKRQPERARPSEVPPNDPHSPGKGPGNTRPSNKDASG